MRGINGSRSWYGAAIGFSFVHSVLCGAFVVPHSSRQHAGSLTQAKREVRLALPGTPGDWGEEPTAAALLKEVQAQQLQRPPGRALAMARQAAGPVRTSSTGGVAHIHDVAVLADYLNHSEAKPDFNTKRPMA